MTINVTTSRNVIPITFTLESEGKVHYLLTKPLIFCREKIRNSLESHQLERPSGILLIQVKLTRLTFCSRWTNISCDRIDNHLECMHDDGWKQKNPAVRF